MQERLTILETRFTKLDGKVDVMGHEIAGVKSDVSAVRSDVGSFIVEYRRNEVDKAKAVAARTEADAKASHITGFQLIAGATGLFAIASGLVGGAMWIVGAMTTASETRLRGEQTEASTRLRGGIDAEAAKTQLQLARQQESITAAQSAMSQTQRDIREIAVDLGLVKQRSMRNEYQLKQLEHVDELLGRADERSRSVERRVEAVEHSLKAAPR